MRYSYLASTPATLSGVILPYTSPATIITGASPHAPTQRQTSSENMPSAVHSPSPIPSDFSTSSRILPASCSETYRNNVLALRRHRELSVESSNTVNLLDRNAGLIRYDLLYLVRKVTVNILCLLHDRHQGSFLTLVLGDHVKQFGFLIFSPLERNARYFHLLVPPSSLKILQI